LKLSLKNYDFVIAAGGVYSPRAISRAIRLNGKRVISFVLNDSQVISGLTDPVKLPPNIHEVEANYLLFQPLGILPPV
jgi:hypothetical protein